MQRCEDNVAARLSGNSLQPLAGVLVAVTDDHSGLPATLFSDNGVTQLAGNTIVTDDNGYYGFYAANGEYTLTFTGVRIATFTRKVTLQDPDDNPYATKGELAAGSGSALVTFTQAGAGSVPVDLQTLLRRHVTMEQFGADPSGATDSTAAIQAAIDHAASLVAAGIGGVGDPVGGCDVLLSGVYKVSEPLRISTSNVRIIGQGGATIYADFTSMTGYNGAKPVFIVGVAEAWQTSGVIFTNTKYNGIHNIHVKTIAGRQPFIGVLLSGTRNAHVSGCLFENGFCGLYLENTSEFLSEQNSIIGCTYGIVEDNRGNRSAANSVLNVACLDNDVSSNTFVMTALYYAQHTGFLALNAGTSNISGMTIGNFSENPLTSAVLGFPLAHSGIHIAGGGLKWTRGMMVNSVVLEPTPSQQIDCVRIDAASGSNPVVGVSLNNLHVQTHASDYATGKYTVLLRMVQSGTGTIRNVVLRDSGFTPQSAGYYTGTMCINTGNGEVAFDGCYPAAAFASSVLGTYSTLRDVEHLERTVLNSLIPTGWNSDGMAGSSLLGGSSGVPASIKFTGSTAAIGLYKDFYFREYPDIRQVFISVLYRGDCGLLLKARVNGDTVTDSDIASVDNVPRYGNAILTRPAPLSTTEWQRAILCFNPFDANYPFDRVLFIFGKTASATSANFVEVKDVRIGYLIGAPAPYNPFA